MLLSIVSLLSKGDPFAFTNKKMTAVSIYQNAEDDVADTIKPKLEIHKANCNNVCYIEKENYLLFMDDDSIFYKAQKQGISIRTLKTVKSTMTVQSIKKIGIRYWKINSKVVGSNAEQ